MKAFEYNQFNDVYVPYLIDPQLARINKFKVFLETVIAYAQIPIIAKLAIYQAFKEL